MSQIFTDHPRASGYFHLGIPWPEPGQWDLFLTKVPFASTTVTASTERDPKTAPIFQAHQTKCELSTEDICDESRRW